MKNLFILSFLLFSVVTNSFTQNLKKSDKYLNKAISLIAEKDIVNAEKYLKKSIEENPANNESFTVLGDLFYDISDFKTASYYYLLSDSISSETYLKYKLANSYFKLEDYGNAKKYYQKYIQKTPTYYKGYKIAKTRIENCNFGIEAKKHPVEFNPISVGKGINTQGYEYNPVVSADGFSLIYTGIRNKHGRKVEDFYISNLENGVWQKGIPLPGNVNTNENEGAHCVSADGRFLFFTSCGRPNGYGSCDIYVSVKVNGKWSDAVNLGNRVNSTSWDAHPAISPDGSTLIFSSNRPGGKGNKDLWSIKFVKGKWEKPRNLSELNTKGNEVTPFLHLDGKTLYFSSDGLPGMGGTDFYVSRFDDETNMWSKPKNLGYKINSSRDEYSLTVARDGKTAYFATDALDGPGKMDIYSFVLNKSNRSTKTAYLKGRIIEMSNKRNIINSDLLIVDLKTSEPVKTVHVDEGNYVALLPVGKVYAIVAKAPKHLLYSTTFEFMTDSISDFIVKNIKLQRFRKGMKMNLNNINFESGQSKLLEESYFELNLLVTYLKTYSKYRVKIIGHTDDVGTKEYNQKLSEDRAEAVKDYLVSKGINPTRLEYYGEGETRPISENNTAKGRKKNRRTEIVLY